jgi:flagellar basal body-associated protein FliL
MPLTPQKIMLYLFLAFAFATPSLASAVSPEDAGWNGAKVGLAQAFLMTLVVAVWYGGRAIYKKIKSHFSSQASSIPINASSETSPSAKNISNEQLEKQKSIKIVPFESWVFLTTSALCLLLLSFHTVKNALQFPVPTGQSILWIPLLIYFARAFGTMSIAILACVYCLYTKSQLSIRTYVGATVFMAIMTLLSTLVETSNTSKVGISDFLVPAGIGVQKKSEQQNLPLEDSPLSTTKNTEIKKDESTKHMAYMRMPNIVVKLADPGTERVARIEFTLVIANSDDREVVLPYIATIHSSIVQEISGLNSTELLAADGLSKLTASILRQANLPFGEYKKPFNNVLFGSFFVE